MAGAGGLVALLLGIDGAVGQSLVIAVVGVIMIVYVLIGGMKGTTWVQIVKAVLLIIGAGVMTVWVLGKYGFSLSDAARARRSTTSPKAGEKPARPRPAVRQDDHDQARLHLARRWPWCSAPPACRTC